MNKTGTYIRPIIALALTGLALGPAALHARPFELSENTWSNPEFVQWFTGTYAFDGQINPQITREEQALLQEIAPLMARDPNAAIRAIRDYQQAVPAGAPAPSAALDYTIGSLQLQQSNFDAAKEAYGTALTKFPTFYRAHQNLGLARVQTSAYKEALPHLTRALELGGGSGIVWGLIGYSYLNTGRPTQALAAYEQALLFQPDSRDWLLGKLNAAIDTGNNALAISMLNEMLESGPDEVNFWLQQANAFLGSGETLEAAVNLEWVARKGAGSAQSHLLLGDIYLSEQLPVLALASYREALAKGGVDASRMLRVAEKLLQFGANREADEFLDTVDEAFAGKLTDAEQLQLLNQRAQVAMQMGDRDAAAEMLEQVIGLDPLNGSALLGLGDYYRDTGDLARAILQYERAAQVDAVKVRALVGLARVHVSRQSYRLAVHALEQAQAIDPRPYVAEYIDQLERLIRRG